MTEEEWLACADTETLLAFLGVYQGGGANKRKARLLASASCRRLWTVIPADMQELLALAELHADKELKTAAAKKLPAKRDRLPFGDRRKRAAALAAFRYDDLDALRESVIAARDLVVGGDGDAHLTQLDAAVRESQRDVTGGEVVGHARQMHGREQSVLVRDIFGNPFRPVAFAPEWRTDTAVALARQMYDSRDSSAVPILADALQDAGCNSDDILTHCRDANQPHIRGCWVLDLVLGKE